MGEVLDLKRANEKLMNELKDIGHEKTKIETSLNVEIDHLQKSLGRETEKSASDNSKMRTNLKEMEERNKKEKTEHQKMIQKLSAQLKQVSHDKQEALDEVSKLTTLKESFEREKQFMEKQLQNSEEEKNIIEDESRKTIMDLENTFSSRLDGIQAHSDMIRQEIRQKEATVRELSAENDSLNGQIADMEDTLRVSVLMMKMMKGALGK